MSAFNVVPQSWWTTYTRALLGSRGTPHWIDRMLEQRRALRDAWDVAATNYLLSKGIPDAPSPPSDANANTKEPT